MPRPGIIRPRLVVDDVYDQLVVLIVDGHVQPEDALSIDALAREFGVSTSPVREALARLESTGLIRRVAMRGYRVAPALQASELRELMDARLLIEPGAAARAAAASPREGTVAALDDAVVDLAHAPRGAATSRSATTTRRIGDSTMPSWWGRATDSSSSPTRRLAGSSSGSACSAVGA